MKKAAGRKVSYYFLLLLFCQLVKLDAIVQQQKAKQPACSGTFRKARNYLTREMT
jgi:hypothetical protein